MNAIPRLLVVAALACSTPALADLVVPASPAPDAPAKDVLASDAAVAVDAAASAPHADEVLDAADTPGDVPRHAVPPPIDEELMKTLPPPSMGALELVGPLAKTMLMLCVVLLIVYLTLYKGLGKLVERQNAGKRVRVVERVTLDQKRALFLVEIDGKQMLLAAGEGGVVHLKDVDAATGEARAPSSSRAGGSNGSGGFASKLAEALKSKMPGAQPPVTTGLARAEVPIASESKSGGVS